MNVTAPVCGLTAISAVPPAESCNWFSNASDDPGSGAGTAVADNVPVPKGATTAISTAARTTRETGGLCVVPNVSTSAAAT